MVRRTALQHRQADEPADPDVLRRLLCPLVEHVRRLTAHRTA